MPAWVVCMCYCATTTTTLYPLLCCRSHNKSGSIESTCSLIVSYQNIGKFEIVIHSGANRVIQRLSIHLFKNSNTGSAMDPSFHISERRQVACLRKNACLSILAYVREHRVPSSTIFQDQIPQQASLFLHSIHTCNHGHVFNPVPASVTNLQECLHRRCLDLGYTWIAE